MVALAGMRLGLFTDEYGPLFAETAKRFGAYYLPELIKGILGDAKLKSDAVHPNAAGYRLIAQRVAEKIKPLLAEAERRRGGGGRG
jgi:lysophospholipase L1-like esterase